MTNIKIKDLICSECKKDLDKYNGQRVYLNKSTNEIVCSSCFGKKNISKGTIDNTEIKFPKQIQDIVDLEKKLEFLKGKKFTINNMFSFIDSKINWTKKEIAIQLAKKLFEIDSEFKLTKKEIESKINENIKNNKILNND